MKQPKRYEPGWGADCCGSYAVMREDESGDYVEWVDYELLAAKHAGALEYSVRMDDWLIAITEELDIVPGEHLEVGLILDVIASLTADNAALREDIELIESGRVVRTKDFHRWGVNRPNPSGPGFIGFYESEHDTLRAAIDDAKGG